MPNAYLLYNEGKPECLVLDDRNIVVSVPIWVALHGTDKYAWTGEPFDSGQRITVVERMWLGSREPIERYIRRTGIVQQRAPIEQRELDMLIAESNAKTAAYFEQQNLVVDECVRRLSTAEHARAAIFQKESSLEICAEQVKKANEEIARIHKEWGERAKEPPFPSLDYLASKKYFEVNA